VLCFVLAVHDLADMTADGATLASLIFKSLMKVGLDMTPVATIGVGSALTNLGEEKGQVSQISKLLVQHETQQPPVVAGRFDHHIAHNATKEGDEAMSGLCTVVSVQAGGARSWAFRTWDWEARAVRVHYGTTRWWRRV
jgi:hypothetical protein